jgi:lipopolysaccharide biosynthesis glycosyltransferase
MEITVLFCIDKNYWQHLGVAIVSLLRSNPMSVFRVIVASAAAMDQVQVREIDALIRGCGNGRLETVVFQGDDRYRHLPVHSHFTSAMYLRLFMADYLENNIDKVLYLDSDLIVCGNISSMWKMDLGDYFLGGAPEPYCKQRSQLNFGPGDLYVNSGVLLVNLGKWRAENVSDRFIEFAEANIAVIQSPDQDILNCVLRGKIFNIGYRWNWQALFPRFLPEELGLSIEEYGAMRRSPSLIHYTSRYKPWYYRWAPHYQKLYYHWLAQTKWAGYVPPDKSFGNFPLRIVKSLQRWLEWYLPKVAWRLRSFSRALDPSQSSSLVPHAGAKPAAPSI